MRLTQPWLAVGFLTVCMTLPACSWAKSSLDMRLDKLENILENQISFDLLNQLDAMQQEVQELRGKIDEQQNALQLLNQKQDKLFLNLDSRIAGIDKNSVAIVTKPQNSERTEKKDYDIAYSLMNNKKSLEAIAAFKGLLSKYPNGTFVPNAYYWLGEIYTSQWHTNRSDNESLYQAMESFKVVVDDFNNHHKAVDALLRLGLVELEQEHWLSAKNLLTKVVEKYPGSSRARLAEVKLQSMQQDGNI